jgi:hypothetical protein
MRLGLPDFRPVLTAIRELPAVGRDGKLVGSVTAGSRSRALKAPVGSRDRQLWVAFNRGFVTGGPMWSVWKRRRLRDLPDEATDSPGYRSGLVAGEFLVQVMFELAMDFQHADPSNLGALISFSVHYGGSMTTEVSTGVGDGSSVLEWVRDSDTLFRAHAAAAYDAESHCFGVGERIELEFLRALAKRTGVPVPDDAEARIAERRRDAKNLPTGVEWSEMPEPAPLGGPTDGAPALTAEAVKVLRREVRLIEWGIILDSRGDGAWYHRGVLAGLTAVGRVPLLTSDGGDLTYHRGRLAGSLDAALLRSRGELSFDPTRLTHAYARALASTRAQALLREPPPDGVLRADALARYLTNRNVGRPREDADALAFFNWLAEQAEVSVTPAVLELREHIVIRSIDRPPEEPPDSPKDPSAE